MSEVVKFKSKDKLIEEEVMKASLSIPEGIKRERFIRLELGTELPTDRLLISNILIEKKFRLREIYKDLDYYEGELNRTNKILKSGMVTSESGIKSYESYKKQLEGLLAAYGKELDTHGLLLVYLVELIDKYFSNDEIIQLLGGEYTQANRIKEFYDKSESGTKCLCESYIIHHIEYRWRKGRCKDFIDCPRYEMPLFYCLSDYIWKCIGEDPKARMEMDRVTEELFSEFMVNVVCDENGNVIETEKVVQELTAKELIRNYRGKFVNDLKKINVFDDSKKYKIKRVVDGIYDVLDNEKNVVGRIYK